MKHVIIGTAGHVDHGKTTLIQALTGTNPDRLKEEQERGMTIDIGFAALTLPDGTVAGIVDVPGHERFLKNMLAGASGVDVVLLVVAADESVMPQTIEHLDILRLLEVGNGVVAMTKIDMVDSEWADAVEEDLRDQLKESFLANAPIIRVSARTGQGIEALRRALMAAVSRAEARSAALPFRLPVDRVFTRPGFGTVVTGTLVAGTLRSGDSAQIVPQRLDTRVRGLQVHGRRVDAAEAGTRVAVNLASVEVEAIQRGAQLAPAGAITPTATFDAALRLLDRAPKPLRNRARVRVHIGTAEVIGRIRFLDGRTELAPGQHVYAQFRGEEEFACARGDRFVIRAYSPMVTIGGGLVLDSQPARHRSGDAAVLEALAARERGSADDIVESLLLGQPTGLSRRDIAARVNLPETEVASAIGALSAAGTLLALSADRFMHRSILAGLEGRARGALTGYHERFPLRPGMPREEFRAAMGRDVDQKTFATLLAWWQPHGVVAAEGGLVRLPDFQVELNDRQRSLLARIEAFYRECGIASPTIDEVCAAVKAPPDAVNALIRVGIDQKRLAKVQEGVYYLAETLDAMKDIVRKYTTEHGPITVAAFRDETHSNRKFALLILEYFDAIGFTRRIGDERTVA